MTIDFSDLEDDLPPARGSTDQQRFPCQICGGSGKWTARRANKYGDDHCFACKGKGYFLTSQHDRAKARAQRVERKRSKAKAAMDLNTAHEALFAWLMANRDWNSFAGSLIEQHVSGRAWSENQIAAAERMRAKCEAKRAERDAERDAASVEVDLAPIAEMFATAAGSGYKRPLYRAEGVRLKPGRDGALYVLDDERMELGHFGEQPMYLGKICGGKFQPGRNALPETSTALLAIAQNPRGAAVKYGQRTGRCSCCGRELTKHASIEAGIGPICAEKWGL